MAKMAELNAQGVTNLYDYNQGFKAGMEHAIKQLASREAEPFLGVGYDLETLVEVIDDITD